MQPTTLALGTTAVPTAIPGPIMDITPPALPVVVQKPTKLANSQVAQNSRSGTGLVITLTVLVIAVLSALAVFAYSQSK